MPTWSAAKPVTYVTRAVTDTLWLALPEHTVQAAVLPVGTLPMLSAVIQHNLTHTCYCPIQGTEAVFSTGTE